MRKVKEVPTGKIVREKRDIADVKDAFGMTKDHPNKGKALIITKPHMKTIMIRIGGMIDRPYVQHRFGEKARKQMLADMALGDAQKKKGRSRPPRGDAEFLEEYNQAMYKMASGEAGIPCTQFRKAMVTAHKLVGQKMTIGKLCIFIRSDGIDARDGTPLVRIRGKASRRPPMAVRNSNGSTDFRDRPFFDGWEATLRIRFDADIYSEEDIANLAMRVGWQVGIGEGRPDSPHSCGMEWGLFDLLDAKGKRIGYDDEEAA